MKPLLIGLLSIILLAPLTVVAIHNTNEAQAVNIDLSVITNDVDGDGDPDVFIDASGIHVIEDSTPSLDEPTTVSSIITAVIAAIIYILKQRDSKELKWTKQLFNFGSDILDSGSDIITEFCEANADGKITAEEYNRIISKGEDKWKKLKAEFNGLKTGVETD